MDSLEAVLGALEYSLNVALIATFELKTCGADEQWRVVLASDTTTRYDQFPVKEEANIIGVLERENRYGEGQSVRDVMRPLDDAVVVASSTGILPYINLAADSHYHLVLSGHRISGIVTPSDLLKLPVRTMLFTLISHLEATMAQLIEAAYPHEEWVNYLSTGRLKKLEAELQEQEAAGLEAGRLLLTQFADKRDILEKGLIKSSERSRFRADMNVLRKLRDQVMHSNNYLHDLSYLRNSTKTAQSWIAALGDILAAEQELIGSNDAKPTLASGS